MEFCPADPSALILLGVDKDNFNNLIVNELLEHLTPQHQALLAEQAKLYVIVPHV